MEDIELELINAVEFARRLGISAPAISKFKKQGKFTGTMKGSKFYFRRSCRVIGRDPDNIHVSNTAAVQKKAASDRSGMPKDSYVPPVIPDKKTYSQLDPDFDPNEVDAKIDKILKNTKDSKSLEKFVFSEIKKVILDKTSINDRALLDRTRIKMDLLKQYHITEQEKLKTKKLEGNLFSREEVIEILSFSMNIFRNSLINLDNNYTVNLFGLSQKEIKKYVSEDISRILSDLQNTGKKFMLNM